MKEGKVLENVGALDLREATEASIAGIREIGNVGLVLISPETRGLLSKIPRVGNVGATLELPASAKLINGQKVFTRDTFKEQDEPLVALANGQIVFSQDIPVEDVREGIEALWLNGQIVYPDHLAGAIESKTRSMNGQAVSYMDCTKMVLGDVRLDEAYLKALDPATRLVAIGSLKAYGLLDNALIAERIERLQLTGSITCRQENKETLLAHLEIRGDAPKLTEIPEGHDVLHESVTLDETTLRSLPGKNLYCVGSVEIASDVTEAALREAITSCKMKGTLIAPAGLKDTVSERFDLLGTTTVFHEGDVWVEEGKADILPARLDYVERPVTLLVKGKVRFDAGVDPKAIAEKFSAIHNLGKIHCT